MKNLKNLFIALSLIFLIPIFANAQTCTNPSVETISASYSSGRIRAWGNLLSDCGSSITSAWFNFYKGSCSACCTNFYTTINSAEIPQMSSPLFSISELKCFPAGTYCAVAAVRNAKGPGQAKGGKEFYSDGSGCGATGGGSSCTVGGLTWTRLTVDTIGGNYDGYYLNLTGQLVCKAGYDIRQTWFNLYKESCPKTGPSGNTKLKTYWNGTIPANNGDYFYKNVQECDSNILKPNSWYCIQACAESSAPSESTQCRNVASFQTGASICGSGAPKCGNGIKETGEQCDDGTNNGSCPKTCSTNCTTNICPIAQTYWYCSGTSCLSGSYTSQSACQIANNNATCFTSSGCGGGCAAKSAYHYCSGSSCQGPVYYTSLSECSSAKGATCYSDSNCNSQCNTGGSGQTTCYKGCNIIYNPASTFGPYYIKGCDARQSTDWIQGFQSENDAKSVIDNLDALHVLVTTQCAWNGGGGGTGGDECYNGIMIKYDTTACNVFSPYAFYTCYNLSKCDALTKQQYTNCSKTMADAKMAVDNYISSCAGRLGLSLSCEYPPVCTTGKSWWYCKPPGSTGICTYAGTFATPSECWGAIGYQCYDGDSCNKACSGGNGGGGYCGDGICNNGETSATCPADCGVTPPNNCGNGVCDPGENATNCYADCGPKNIACDPLRADPCYPSYGAGQYADTAVCQRFCLPSITRFSCQGGTCIQSPTGGYDNLATCQATGGYNCVGGACAPVACGGAQYTGPTALATCTANCGTGTKYRCQGNVCIQDPNGVTLTQCRATQGYSCVSGICQAVECGSGTDCRTTGCTGVRYGCDNFSCVIKTNGDFDSVQSCQLTGGWTCVNNNCVQVLCTTSTVPYSTQSLCQASGCGGGGDRYSCLANSCVQNSAGAMTLTECNNSCSAPISTYSCLNDQCVPDLNGIYTQTQCNANCPPSGQPKIACIGGTCQEYSSGNFNNITACVASGCGSPQYSCINNECISDSNGNYTSLDSCNAACGIVPPSKYSCIFDDWLGIHGCITDSSGAYTELGVCSAVCPPPSNRFACLNGMCSPDSSGNYNSVDECVASGCTPPPDFRYSCIDGSCITDSNGTYFSQQTCNAFCPPTSTPRFSCIDGSCHSDSSGNYLTYNSCSAVCSIVPPNNQYACLNDVCVPDTSGNYTGINACYADGCGRVDDRYSCIDGACHRDSSGNYTNLDQCNANCSIVPPDRWACVLDGTCHADSSGNYTVSNCNNQCTVAPSRYSCIDDTCQPDSNGNSPSLAQCRADGCGGTTGILIRTVGANAATSTAILTGEVINMGGNSTLWCYFRYAPTSTMAWAATGITQVNGLGFFSTNISGLTPNTNYIFHAFCSASPGLTNPEDGGPGYFTTDRIGGICDNRVYLLTPTSGTTLRSRYNSSLTWTPLPGAQIYQMRIWGNSLATTSIYTTSTSYNAKFLQSDSYNWQVRGCNGVSNIRLNASGTLAYTGTPVCCPWDNLSNFRAEFNDYIFIDTDKAPIYDPTLNRRPFCDDIPALLPEDCHKVYDEINGNMSNLIIPLEIERYQAPYSFIQNWNSSTARAIAPGATTSLGTILKFDIYPEDVNSGWNVAGMSTRYDLCFPQEDMQTAYNQSPSRDIPPECMHNISIYSPELGAVVNTAVGLIATNPVNPGNQPGITTLSGFTPIFVGGQIFLYANASGTARVRLDFADTFAYGTIENRWFDQGVVRGFVATPTFSIIDDGTYGGDPGNPTTTTSTNPYPDVCNGHPGKDITDEIGGAQCEDVIINEVYVEHKATKVCSNGRTYICYEDMDPPPNGDCVEELFQVSIISGGVEQKLKPEILGICSEAENDSPTIQGETIDVDKNTDPLCPAYRGLVVSWKFKDKEDKETQTSYQVKIHKEDGTQIYDTGKVEGNTQTRFVDIQQLGGPDNYYGKKFYAEIIVWDSKGKTGTIQTGTKLMPSQRSPSFKSPFIEFKQAGNVVGSPILFSIQNTIEYPDASSLKSISWSFDKNQDYEEVYSGEDLAKGINVTKKFSARKIDQDIYVQIVDADNNICAVKRRVKSSAVPTVVCEVDGQGNITRCGKEPGQ